MNAPPQQQQGPPAPTAEQLAITDAGFQQVPLALDPESKTLSTPIPGLDLTVLNALIRSLQGLPPNVAFHRHPTPSRRNEAWRSTGERAGQHGVPQQGLGGGGQDVHARHRRSRLATAVEANQVARDELSLCLANRSAAFASCEDWIGALCDAEAVTN